MANNSVYEDLIYQINNLLKQESIYPKYMQAIGAGKNDYKISQVYTKKNYDDSWIGFLEECLVPLDTIVRNPRKFIVIEEDIVDISLARSISVESIKHLAQHTNMIASVTKDGMVIPNKILNTSKEESYEIYENRFIYTLLLKARDFINRRFDVIKQALMNSGELGVEIASDFALDGAKVDFKLDSSANFPFEAAFKKKGEQLSDVERITRINQIFSDFLSSPFAKEMRSCALVRPPITRTNVILKDPNFKKALLLWQFVESSETMDYKIDTVTETAELNAALSEKYRGLVFLSTVLLQSIAATRSEGESLDKTMKQDQVLADEYVTKNIDDYVPDDFPQLKMDLAEIRRIYYRVPGQKTLNLTEIAKINAALDRVLRQYRINKAREDSITQQKLIAQQLREEAEAKKLALREARDLERKKKQEEARLRLEQRRIEAERKAQLRRAEEERKEAERRAEEEKIRIEEERRRLEEETRRMEEERRKEEMRLAEEEAHRLRIVAEQESAARIQEELEQYKARLEAEERRVEAELKERQEQYWKKQRELAIRLRTEKNNAAISANEQAEIESLMVDERTKLASLKRIETTLRSTIIVEHYRAAEDIMVDARKYRSEEEIKSIKDKMDKEEARKEKRDAKKAKSAAARKAATDKLKAGVSSFSAKLKAKLTAKKAKPEYHDFDDDEGNE